MTARIWLAYARLPYGSVSRRRRQRSTSQDVRPSRSLCGDFPSHVSRLATRVAAGGDQRILLRTVIKTSNSSLLRRAAVVALGTPQSHRAMAAHDIRTLLTRLDTPPRVRVGGEPSSERERYED